MRSRELRSNRNRVGGQLNKSESNPAVALIVLASRWLLTSKGASKPRVRDGSTVYGVKVQLRLVGMGIAGFFGFLAIWFRNDPDWPLLMIPIGLGLACLWATSGYVFTDASGITFKMPGNTRSFGWNEITEIRVDKRGVIVLAAGPKKMSIDTRIVARDHLLTEIKQQTRMQPIGSN
jgi:hypothetical protein